MLKIGQLILKSISTMAASLTIDVGHGYADSSTSPEFKPYTFHALRERYVMDISSDNSIDENEAIIKSALTNLESDQSFTSNFNQMVIRINNKDDFFRINNIAIQILKSIDTSSTDIIDNIKKQLLDIETTVLSSDTIINQYKKNKIESIKQNISDLRTAFDQDTFLQNFDVEIELDKLINYFNDQIYVIDIFGRHLNFFKDIDKLKSKIDAKLISLFQNAFEVSNNAIINSFADNKKQNAITQISGYFNNSNVYTSEINDFTSEYKMHWDSISNRIDNTQTSFNDYVSRILHNLNVFKSQIDTSVKTHIDSFTQLIKKLTSESHIIAKDEFTRITNGIKKDHTLLIADLKKLFSITDGDINELDKYNQIYCDIELDLNTLSSSTTLTTTFKFLANGHEYHRSNYQFVIMDTLEKIFIEISELTKISSVDSVILEKNNWNITDTLTYATSERIEILIKGYIDLVHKYNLVANFVNQVKIQNNSLSLKITLTNIDGTKTKILNFNIPYSDYNDHFNDLKNELVQYINKLNFNEIDLLTYSKNFAFSPDIDIPVEILKLLPNLPNEISDDNILNKEISFKINVASNDLIASTRSNANLKSLEFVFSIVIFDKYSNHQSSVFQLPINNVTSILQTFQSSLKLNKYIFESDISPLTSLTNNRNLKYIFNNYYDDFSLPPIGIYLEYSKFLKISYNLVTTSNSHEYEIFLHINRIDHSEVVSNFSFKFKAIYDSNPVDFFATELSNLVVSDKIKPDDESLLQKNLKMSELNDIFIGYRNLYNDFHVIGLQSLNSPVYKNPNTGILTIDFKITRPSISQYSKIISLPISTAFVSDAVKKEYKDVISKALSNVFSSKAFNSLPASAKADIEKKLDELNTISARLLTIPFISMSEFNNMKFSISEKLSEVIKELYKNIHDDFSKKISDKLSVDASSIPKEIIDKLQSALSHLKEINGLDELSKLDFSSISLDKIIGGLNYNSTLSYPMLIIICSIFASLAIISLILLINSIKHYKISNKIVNINDTSVNLPKISKIKWIITISSGMLGLLIALSILLILLI